MKSLLATLALVPSLLLGQSRASPRIGVAVMPVAADGQWSRDSLAIRVAGVISRGLAAYPPIVIVDRAPGFMERQRDTLRAGKLVGARVFVLLGLQRAPNGAEVMVRAFNVETSDTLVNAFVPLDTARISPSLQQAIEGLATIIRSRWARPSRQGP